MRRYSSVRKWNRSAVLSNEKHVSFLLLIFWLYCDMIIHVCVYGYVDTTVESKQIMPIYVLTNWYQRIYKGETRLNCRSSDFIERFTLKVFDLYAFSMIFSINLIDFWVSYFNYFTYGKFVYFYFYDSNISSSYGNASCVVKYLFSLKNWFSKKSWSQCFGWRK